MRLHSLAVILHLSRLASDQGARRRSYRAINDKQLAYLKEDIEKQHVRKLVAQKPDYIILDLYADTHYGTCLINGTPVTCNPNSLLKTSFYKLNKDSLAAISLLSNPEQLPKVKEAF